MSDKNETKVKGFRINPQTISVVDQLIKNSGMEPGEWFSEVVQKLATNELTLDKDGISPALRQHFNSDVAALKEATSLITTTFINQMNRIAVEKENWEEKLKSVEATFESKISEKNTRIKSLEENISVLENDLQEANNVTVQLTNRIANFDKLESQLRKEISRLEEDVVRNEVQLSSQKEEHLAEKNHYQQLLEENKATFKEEKEQLHQKIVDLINKLNEADEMRKENSELVSKLNELENTLKTKSLNYEIEVTRLQDQAELEKERALLVRERELREQFHNENKTDLKELYNKLEVANKEIERLKLELSRTGTDKNNK